MSTGPSGLIERAAGAQGGQTVPFGPVVQEQEMGADTVGITRSTTTPATKSANPGR